MKPNELLSFKKCSKAGKKKLGHIFELPDEVKKYFNTERIHKTYSAINYNRLKLKRDYWNNLVGDYKEQLHDMFWYMESFDQDDIE